MTERHAGDSAESAVDLRRRPDSPDRFAAMLAHDLRNPLNVARGRLALAREELESDQLDAVARAHDRMDAIIEDYLLLAREGRMVVDEGPVPLASVAAESWQHVATREATLAIRTERVIRADRRRLRQLLENLLRNAVEHGGRDVTVTVGDLGDGFFVADDGPGIPPSEWSSVFDAGYSSPSRNPGIGLAIVSAVADAHGWAVGVTDDDGTRFELTGVVVDS